jgi:hypothetical protein
MTTTPDQPGIELRITFKSGHTMQDNSAGFHFLIMRHLISNGLPVDSWVPIGGTVLREVAVEMRAVDVPPLPVPTADEWHLAELELELGERELELGELELGQDLDGQAAELERCGSCPAFDGCTAFGCCLISGQIERARDAAAAGQLAAAEVCCVCGSAGVVYRNYQDQPFCGPCADGEPPAAAALELGEDMNGAAPPCHGRESGAAGPLGSEIIDARSTEPPDTEPSRRRRRLDSAIGRIARRARFRSGRLACRSVPRQPTSARRRPGMSPTPAGPGSWCRLGI